MERSVSLKFLVLWIYFLGCFVELAQLYRKAIEPKQFRFDYVCHEENRVGNHISDQDLYKGQINFAFEDYMGENFNCTVVVVATGGMEDKLSFYFTKFDLGNECGPGETYLTLIDGSGWKYENDKNITGLPSKLCGTTFPEEIENNKQFTTASRYLRIEYYGNKPPVGSGFSLIFQHFADPPCKNWQHQCNNGRCIDQALVCTAHNPCGDDSGCPFQVSTGLIAGIVIGCVAVIVLTVLFCKFKPHLKQRCCGEGDSDDEYEENDQRNGREMSEFTRVPYSDTPNDKNGISTNNDNMPPPPAYDVALSNKYGYKDS